MSSLISSAVQKPHQGLKKQPILSKLIALHTAFAKLKKQRNTLKNENISLRRRNQFLEQNCLLMETQILQLREVVTLQANDHLQLKKALNDVSVMGKC